jgi:hypothetical protein
LSVQAIAWVFDHSEAELGARLVALSVANHADKFGRNAWAAVATYAGEAHLSIRQTQYALRKLVEMGELVNTGVHGSRADRRTRVYAFPRMSDGAQNPHPVEPDGVQSSTSRGAESGTHGVHPIAPKPSLNRPEPSKELAPSKSTRERDPLWDVLVECYGEPMRKAKGAWNSAVGDLREVGADPDELRAFILACRDSDKAWATVTPTAAAKHYGQRKLLARRADDLRARAERLMA